MESTLWLDDVREPWKYGYVGCMWVKTAAEAIKELATGKYDFASLDHDLAPEHYPWLEKTPEDYVDATGYDVVKWLEEHPEFWPARGTCVHSANPVGRENMLVVVRAHYGKDFQWASAVNRTSLCL